MNVNNLTDVDCLNLGLLIPAIFCSDELTFFQSIVWHLISGSYLKNLRCLTTIICSVLKYITINIQLIFLFIKRGRRFDIIILFLNTIFWLFSFFCLLIQLSLLILKYSKTLVQNRHPSPSIFNKILYFSIADYPNYTRNFALNVILF